MGSPSGFLALILSVVASRAWELSLAGRNGALLAARGAEEHGAARQPGATWLGTSVLLCGAWLTVRAGLSGSLGAAVATTCALLVETAWHGMGSRPSSALGWPTLREGPEHGTALAVLKVREREDELKKPQWYKNPPGTVAETIHKQAKPSKPAEPEEGKVYACPRHPEIRQPAPGSCPKCGMTLEPEEPSKGQDSKPEPPEKDEHSGHQH